MNPIGRLRNVTSYLTAFFDVALSVLLALTCIVLLYKMLTPGKTTQVAKPATFATGDRVPVVDGLRLDQAEVTLLVALRDDCKFCEASLPFYRRLASATQAQRTSKRLQLLLLTAVDADSGRSYLLRNQLSLDGVVSIPQERRGEFKIAGTPTLLQVDRSGVLRAIWEGQLSKPAEEQLLKALTQLP